MRKLLAVIMLFAGLWVWAGAVPEKGRKDTKFRPIDVNMDSIRVNIQNPRSNYYYKQVSEQRHQHVAQGISPSVSRIRVFGGL